MSIETLSETEKQIISLIRELKFGSVEVTLHEGKVVQLDKTEKFRFKS